MNFVLSGQLKICFHQPVSYKRHYYSSGGQSRGIFNCRVFVGLIFVFNSNECRMRTMHFRRFFEILIHISNGGIRGKNFWQSKIFCLIMSLLDIWRHNLYHLFTLIKNFDNPDWLFGHHTKNLKGKQIV